MSSVQERNSEMVNLLSPDFVRKKDSVYISGIVTGMTLALPGLVSYWPMSVSLDHETSVYADEIMVGSSNDPYYAVQIERAAPNGFLNTGGSRFGQGGAWGNIDGPAITGWIGFGSNFYYASNQAKRVQANYAAMMFVSSQFDFLGAANGAADSNITWVNLAVLDDSGNLHLRSGTAPAATLEVERGTLTGGTAALKGTTYTSHFNYSTDEDTYIRGGKSGSVVYVGDVNNTGGVNLANGGGPTVFGGRVGSAWTAVTFNTGWVDYGGIYPTVLIKKVGDLVFIRGLCYRSSGVSTTILTLPSGYRPPNYLHFPVVSSNAFCEIDIDSSGNVIVIGGTPANWVALNGIHFSTIT